MLMTTKLPPLSFKQPFRDVIIGYRISSNQNEIVDFDMTENNVKTSYGVRRLSFSHKVIILYSVNIFSSNLAY